MHLKEKYGGDNARTEITMITTENVIINVFMTVPCVLLSTFNLCLNFPLLSLRRRATGEYGLNLQTGSILQGHWHCKSVKEQRTPCSFTSERHLGPLWLVSLNTFFVSARRPVAHVVIRRWLRHCAAFDHRLSMNNISNKGSFTLAGNVH